MLDTTKSEMNELEAFRILVEDRFKVVHSKMHSVTSSTPEIDHLVRRQDGLFLLTALAGLGLVMLEMLES